MCGLVGWGLWWVWVGWVGDRVSGPQRVFIIIIFHIWNNTLKKIHEYKLSNFISRHVSAAVNNILQISIVDVHCVYVPLG